MPGRTGAPAGSTRYGCATIALVRDAAIPEALERTFKFIDHEPPVVSNASIEAGQCVEIAFGAGEERHVARFSAGWLRRHCYSSAERKERLRRQRLWDANVIRELPIVDFSDYFTTDAGLRAWLEALCSCGIVMLRGVPAEPGKLLDVARRIGPVRSSNFGDYYDVVSMPNSNAVAYTSMALELHTDLANWRFPPDHQLLFCGAERRRRRRVGPGRRVPRGRGSPAGGAGRIQAPGVLPDRFPLSRRIVRHLRKRSDHLADADGNIRRIRFNNWLRSTLSVPEERVAPLYDALGKFWRRLRDPSYHLTIRLGAGDLVTYDNNRVLHGRESFDPNTGHRHLQGCYINHEDVLSKLALLDRAGR